MAELSDEANAAQERSRDLTGRANALRAEGRWREALPLSFEAVRADPHNPAAAHNLGVLLGKIGRLREGEAALRQALSLAPNSSITIHALAHVLLAQGRYREGWPLYEIRASIPELNTGFPRNFPFPRWHGEPLAGKRLLIFPEQGLGDQIQFARFLPQLVEQAAAVTLLTHPPLERLFRHNFPGAEIVRADGATEFPDPDYWVTLHDLPGVLGIELDTIPSAPYLDVPETWPSLPAGFKVGLKTKGNPKHINDRFRSLPPECAARLKAQLPGTVVSLEPDVSGARDMADTAAIIEQLDLIVSVDTSVAHLAGALGKPCLLLIAGFSPDWRWMFDREDSPWYPRHRLFRSDIEGSWEEAVDRLIAEARLRAADAPVATPPQERNSRIPASLPQPEPGGTAAPMHGAVAPQDEARFPEAHALTLQANALLEQGQWEKALPLCVQAHDADPTSPAAAHNLGVMLTKMGHLAEGEAILRKALGLAPGSALGRHALAHNLLAQGRYRDAWPLYDARIEVAELKTGFPADFAFPRWRGEPLAGKRLVIFPEQGLGDQIQFARFLPRLIAEAREVILLTLPPLERLFRHNFPDAQVICATGKTEFPDPDVWTTMQDFPAALDLALEDVSDAPYLKAPGTWRALGDGFKIGLKTIGNPNFMNDAMRSLPAALAERLHRGLPGRIISLEPADSGAKDMADTAAIMDQLDMVVSVDTSVAHLAGAMGKPCLLLIPGFGPDWRWMADRSDSPWYSNHSLYRGSIRDGWAPAVERLIQDAQRIARTVSVHRGVNQALALARQGQIDDALNVAAEAYRTAPGDPLAVRVYSRILIGTGRLSDAEIVLRRHLEQAPGQAESRYALAWALLAQGRYPEAWPLFEARTEVEWADKSFPRNLAFPRWKGEDLSGKRIAIFPEQGLGDQIQFARFIPELLRRGAQVTLLTRLPLTRLFAYNFPGVEVLPALGKVEFADPDYWTTLIDLAVVLNVAVEQIPTRPYLRWNEVRETPGSGPKIGVKLEGNSNHENDAWRSLSKPVADRLLESLPGTVVNLDPQASGARDFADTAAIIAGLDLVVSVDTSVAHLAGAMGKPCLLLVAGYDPDWRWMHDRSDTPWYPRHRLFRSSTDGDWSQAMTALVDAIEPTLRRSAAEGLMKEAEKLRAEGRPVDALAAAEQAVATDPSSVNAAYMHGVFLSHFGRLTEAEAVLRRVVEAAPDLPNARYGLGTNLLAQGRWFEGWPLYDARTESEGLNDGFPSDFPYPRWRGESLKGKRIAIFPEQGLGDQIQFARFIPGLQRAGATVTLLAAPPLAELFRYSFPNVEVLSAAGAVDFPDPDFWATLADLPVRFGVQPEFLVREPYLRVPAPDSGGAESVFRVGLMTRGNPAFSNDLYRSLPRELEEALRKSLPGHVIDLAPEATGAKDLAETAAIIAGLDLVVSVDTAVAHLAGAMGKVCMLMLSGFASDWRWMRGRNDTPWYPEHLLYRAEIDSGWQPVIERVGRDAHRLARLAARYLRQAVTLRAQHRYDEALVAGRKALAAEPKNPTALHNLARLVADFGQMAEAEKLQRRALKAKDEDIYRYGLGLNLLSQGRYAEGWPLYESRTRLSVLRTGFPQGVKFPRWMGEDITGKRIVVFPEQGLGDQLQFARFLPQLRERCDDVVLLASPPLVRLFEQAFPGLTVVKAAGAAQFPKSDVWTTLVELGRLLDVRLETLPSPEYLHIESSRSGEGGFRIGFMAKGNPGYVHDFHRSLPQQDAARLRAALPGEVVDLDPEVSGAKNFLDTAAIMANLDLIVSVDTSVGHLAGVMGKPCCLLIPGFGTDWRWLHDRSDSPWYPKHRLFRGGVDGNWSEAVAALIAHVEELAGQAAALP